MLTQTTFSSNGGILCFHSRFNNSFSRKLFEVFFFFFEGRKLFKVVLLHNEYMRKIMQDYREICELAKSEYRNLNVFFKTTNIIFVNNYWYCGKSGD